MNEPLVQYQIDGFDFQAYRSPSGQLLKWIGNKQRFAESIASYFPKRYNTFIEPFLGSGAVLATVAPMSGIGADVFKPLVEIWQTLKASPATITDWYTERWNQIEISGKKETYAAVLRAYNANPKRSGFSVSNPKLLRRSRSVPQSGWLYVNALRHPRSNQSHCLSKTSG